jgi:hypothetical protein
MRSWRPRRVQPLLERGRVVAERVFAPFGQFMELLAAVRLRLQIIRIRQRATVHRRFPTPLRQAPAPRVLAVITHITSERYEGSLFVERLSATLDGLLLSLCRTRLELGLNPLPGRHAARAAYSAQAQVACDRD